MEKNDKVDMFVDYHLTKLFKGGDNNEKSK